MRTECKQIAVLMIGSQQHIMCECGGGEVLVVQITKFLYSRLSLKLVLFNCYFQILYEV